MKVNTVVISLDRLKELELAEKKLNKPRSKTVIIESYMLGSYVVDTDDECIEKLAEDLKDARRRIDVLKHDLRACEKESVSKISIEVLKEMSVWDFIRWKKSN